MFKQVKLKLSRILNFIDGLSSYCGSKKFASVDFTTQTTLCLAADTESYQHADMHVLCNPCVYKQLTFYYLGFCHHSLFDQIERFIVEIEVTLPEETDNLMKSINA